MKTANVRDFPGFSWLLPRVDWGAVILISAAIGVTLWIVASALREPAEKPPE